MTRSVSRWGVAVAALSTGAALLLTAAPASAATGPVVTTDKGTVQGAAVDGVDGFEGIPYAAPPTGALRWQPPQPAAAWSGTRSAKAYGPRCAALASTNGARSDSEDCLYLNVWRPTGTTAGDHLPVYVFIHGGGLVNGSSNQAGGGQFAQRTGAVVVSLNYRLGIFGFLGVKNLSSQGQGDYGFLDQQAALTWVQRNISSFGGDARQVTVGGESAGAFSVCGHLTSPGSRGLFAAAMLQSGGCPSRSVDATHAASEAVAAKVGCTDPATLVGCLRSTDEATLLEASTSFSPSLTSGTAALPLAPATAVATGQFTKVPVVNGANRDEGRTFFAGFIGASQQQYEAFVRSTFGAQADAVLAHYPWPAQADRFTPAYLIGAIFTDSGLLSGIGGCGTLALDRQLARYVPTYGYEFDARYGPGLTPIDGYVWGAGHAAELAYLFPSFDNGTPIAPTFNAGERQLSRDMTTYWGDFVTHGSPSVGSALPAWPAFPGGIQSLRPAGRTTTLSTTQFEAEHQCGFWSSVTGSSAAVSVDPATARAAL